MKRRLRNITLSDLWKIAPIAISIMVLCLMPLKEGDLWWNLLAGDEIIQTRGIPQSDFLTFTARGEPYAFSHYWLSGLILAALYRYGGFSALVMLQAVVGTIIVYMILKESLQRGVSPPVAGGMALLSLAGLSTFISTRPQIFSFLLFAFLFRILSCFQRGRNQRLWLIPIILVAWINLHPGWSIGVLLLVAWFTLDLIKTIIRKEPLVDLKPLFLWGVLGSFALLLNPEGWRALEDPFILGRNPIIQTFISEWQPATINIALTWPLFFLSGLLFVALAFSRKRPGFIDFFLLLVFLGNTLRYVRMIPFWVILSTPIIAGLASGLTVRQVFNLQARESQDKPVVRRGIRGLNYSLAFLLLLAVLFSLPPVRLGLTSGEERQLVSSYFPSKAGDFLADLPDEAQRIFTMPEWGGYLAWRTFPVGEVFVDGRVELFPISTWQDYLMITNAVPGWSDRLAEYGVDYLVLSQQNQSGLISSVKQAGLNCPYADETTVICENPLK